MGDDCVYGPPPQQKQEIVRLQSPQLSSTGFSMQDLRYFHSFLTASYPSFPFETDHAWTHDIPVIAQEVGILAPVNLSRSLLAYLADIEISMGF